MSSRAPSSSLVCAVVSLVLAAQGCGDGGTANPPPPEDTGTDVGSDLGADVPADTAPDTAADTGGDAMDVSDAADASDAPPRCASNADCAGATAVCDTATGRCVQCVASADTCPAAQHCDAATNACVAGCRSDEGCAPTDGGATGGPRCDVATHTCVACTTDVHCPLGQRCVGNACVPGCDAARGCPAGQTCCAAGCVDTLTSTAHCGACGAACAPANATASCVAGTCRVGACREGFSDCNGRADDGCEVNLTTDRANCGTCGTRCCGACVSGRCFADGAGLTVCPRGPDGCVNIPRNLQTDPQHCGMCDRACALANATPACVAGACAVATCNAGFGDCDAMAANGCETDTRTTVAHCGTCGRACTVANGTAGCAAGACTVAACDAGFGDCDLMAANGCETDLRATATHCGLCGVVCATGQVCVSGACVAPNPVPVLTALSPAEVVRGAPATTLHLTGSGFARGATVRFGATTLTPIVVTPTEITVTVPATELAAPRAAEVTVTNPAPGGGRSELLTFRVTLPPVAVAYVPGAATVHVYSAVANTVEPAVDTGSGYTTRPALALGPDGVGVLREVPRGTLRLTGTAPFLAWIHDELGGDKITAGSTLGGAGRGATLLTWGGSAVTVFSNDASPGLVRLQRFEGTGFVDAGSWTPMGPNEFHAFPVSTSTLYRVVARDAPVTAVGQVLTETYNHFGYVMSTTGSPRGVAFHYAEPAGAPGVRHLVVQALEPATMVTFTGGAPAGTVTLAATGDTAQTVFPAGALVRASASAPVLAWVEAEPGNGTCDGTLLDADLVPSVRGQTTDTEFVFRTTTQPVGCYATRRPDLDVLGYHDDTTVTVYVAGAATPTATHRVGRAGRVTLGTDLAPGTRYRVVASRPVAVEMSHEAFQFAFRVASVATLD